MLLPKIIYIIDDDQNRLDRLEKIIKYIEVNGCFEPISDLRRKNQNRDDPDAIKIIKENLVTIKHIHYTAGELDSICKTFQNDETITPAILLLDLCLHGTTELTHDDLQAIEILLKSFSPSPTRLFAFSSSQNNAINTIKDIETSPTINQKFLMVSSGTVDHANAQVIWNSIREWSCRQKHFDEIVKIFDESGHEYKEWHNFLSSRMGINDQDTLNHLSEIMHDIVSPGHPIKFSGIWLLLHILHIQYQPNTINPFQLQLIISKNQHKTAILSQHHNWRRFFLLILQRWFEKMHVDKHDSTCYIIKTTQISQSDITIDLKFESDNLIKSYNSFTNSLIINAKQHASLNGIELGQTHPSFGDATILSWALQAAIQASDLAQNGAASLSIYNPTDTNGTPSTQTTRFKLHL